MNKLVTMAASSIIGALFVFTACTPAGSSVTGSIQATPISIAPVKAGWETEWNKTLELARKEGRVVVVGGSGAAALKDAVDLMKNKFGIALEITSARGEQIFSKITTERAAGIYGEDLILTGHNSMFSMKEKGMYDPIESRLILPEVVNPNVWIWGKLPFADDGHYMFNVSYFPEISSEINTSIVRPGEIKSFYDYLDPKWKEKIVMADPSATGSGGPQAWTLIQNKVLNLDFFRQLVLQKPMVLRDDDLILRWLAMGKYPIALFASSGVVAKYQEAGAPIQRQLLEAQILSAGGSALAMMNKAPHPNAATLFINWLLSKEGSTFFQNAQQKQSSRIDISVDGLLPINRRTEGVQYIRKVNEVEELILNREDEKFFAVMSEIFAPVLK